MAQKLKKNIEAAQNFLAGLQTLSIFQEMRLKQVMALEVQISKAAQLSTSDAASLLSILHEDLWGCQAPRLKEAVAAKVAALEPKTSEFAGRRKNQDYLQLPNYLAADIWDQLRSSELNPSQRLDVVCRHAAALGLRCPSEKTIAMLLALSHGMYQEPYEDEKLNLVNQYRARIGKHMALPATAEHLLQLPAKHEELPASIAAIAFAGGGRVDAPLKLPDFRAMAESWPVRTTRGGKDFDSGRMDDKISLEQVGYMMKGVARAQSEQFQRENFEFKRSHSLLALEDWKDDEVRPPAPATKAHVGESEGVDAVAATLAELRDKTSSIPAEKKEEPQMKRPAAVLRRPAAAQKKIFQTDAEPAGPAPLGTSDVEKELEALQLCKTKRQKNGSVSSKKGDHSMSKGQKDEEPSLLSNGRKEVKGKPLATVLTPTSTRRGSHVAEGKPKKRPASKQRPSCASVMDSSPMGREPHSAGAASQSSASSELQRQEPRSAEARKKSGHGKTMKRPAAKKAARRPMGTVAEREARRRAVLAIVPRELREQFRDGCATCRGRTYCTVSCWAKRGFIA